MMLVKRKAVFLDKDGTLVENRPFDGVAESFVLLPGTTEGLQMLHQAGYLLVVVTNQGGVAQGSITEDNLADIEVALRIRLASANIPLAGFYYCPHHPEGLIPRYSIHCSCRKPQSGLLYQATRELRIDLARSWMIGDILHDVEAGRSAGCRTVLLANGNETEWDMSASRWPDILADNVWGAARSVLGADPPQQQVPHEPETRRQ
jgi:D-glycero-D-manno-heptose 1,7-bisphosphate phosphatase